VEGVPAHGRGLELDDLQGPFQPKPSDDSVILNTSRDGGSTTALGCLITLSVISS